MFDAATGRRLGLPAPRLEMMPEASAFAKGSILIVDSAGVDPHDSGDVLDCIGCEFAHELQEVLVDHARGPA
jgi:hypothetical protein